jgi:hypothetical protein
LPLGAPGIPGRGSEQENISVQQILRLRFLRYRFLDLPAWGNALQRSDQRIHHVRRVTAGRGKDDMEDSTPNEVRDSIGGVVHALPPLSTSDRLHLSRSSFNGSRLAYPDATKYFHRVVFKRTHRIHIIMADTLLSGPALVAKRPHL